MPRDDDQSLGGEQTFAGKIERDDSPQSLGDQGTYAGGPGIRDPQSLGDEATFGDAGGGDEPFDDGMEVVDLSKRYTFEGTLGKGGMGEVLLATDTRLERKVAIKRILGDAAKSWTAVSRFLTEAKSIAALGQSDNIVRIYDYGRATDGPFLIMEYIDGGSLLDRCREGALDLDEAIDLTCQLCDGLEYAHDANIIHRDIKPANVLMTAGGRPKLTDFGLARQDTGDAGQTMAGAVLGTLDFMPPEQRNDATTADHRSDLWSLAATLYQMVTGESPRVIDLDDVPPQLRTTLSMALKTNPDARYQTAREFKEALQVTTGTVPQPIRKPAAELGAGECPECHIPNESSRKFCSECAAPLRVSCLKCEAEIPVWDKVCGECGGKQSELAAAKLEEFASRRAEAEDCRRSYLFEEAIRIGRTLAEVDDERIAEHVPWAAEFVTSTEADWKRARESAEQHFEEAQTHRAAFDYQSAIHTLHSVPDAMRTSGMSDYLNRLESDQAESEELIATISDRVKRRDLKGLLEQVERAVALRGDRADLDKLAGQLREREEKRQRDKTTRLFDSGDAKGALAMLRSVPSEKLSSDDKKFLRRLEEIVSAEVELRALLKESKAGGVLAPKEVVALWKATNDYLQLNPHHEQIAGLQQQLKSRIRRTPELWNWYRTRLTLDVAKRFLATPESMPPLSWYESMSDEAAEALANHSGNRLSVAGLTRLSVEAAQLGHGECPKCHTRNESSRNFCSECEAPLRVRCLNCETEIPVWDNYCDECGGNQSELAASKLEAAKALAKRTNTLVLSGLTSLSVEAAEALAKHTGDLNYDDAKLPSDVVSILKDGGTRLTLDSDVVSILKDGGARLTLDVAQRFLADPRSTYLFDYETIELDAAEALAKHADSLYLDCLKSLSVEVAEALAKHTDSLHLNGLTSLSVEVAEALAKHTDSLWLNGLTSLSMEVAEALAKHKDSLIVNGLTSLSVEAAETLAKHQSYISYDAAKLPPDVVSILKRDATKLTRNVYTAQDVDVVLTGFGNNKIAVMKVVRAATGLGLKAAKEVVENAPTVVKECISKEDAEKLKEDIEGVGGSVEIKAPTLDTAQDVDVVLTGFGDNKIAVMKVVRAATGLGLKEAKEVVENAPTVVKECISSFSAEQLKEDIEGVGGSVEIKAVGSKNRTDLEAP